MRIVESPLPLQTLEFLSSAWKGWGGRGGESVRFFFIFQIILSQPESRRFPFSDLKERVFRFSDICIEKGVSSGFEKCHQAAIVARLSIYPP